VISVTRMCLASMLVEKKAPAKSLRDRMGHLELVPVRVPSESRTVALDFYRGRCGSPSRIS
jgi:hypothetical protein